MEGVAAIDISSGAKSSSNDAENSGEKNADNCNDASGTERGAEEDAEETNNIEEEGNQVERELETSQVIELVALELSRKVGLLDVEVSARVEGVVGLVLGAANEFTRLLDRLALLITAETVERPTGDRVLGITKITSVSSEEVPLLENTRGLRASKHNEEKEQSAASQKQKTYELERNTN